MILVDCGEGTQIPFRQAGWGVVNLDAILFTHYHADHIGGLPGLLLTLQNGGRKEPLVLIGPKGIDYVVKSLTVIAQHLSFQLKCISLDDLEFPHRMGDFIIDYQYLDHNVKCVAYSLSISRIGKFDVEKAKENNVPLKIWNQLQKGESIENDGLVYTPEMVLGPDRKGIKLSYCTDSRPIKELESFVRDSDLLICEGMYGDDESMAKAYEKKHMTFFEAASIAKAGEVKELWLTHFSPSLNYPGEYIQNAKKVFENTVVGKDLMKKTLIFEEEG
jgi:ribonuclease Z